MKPETLTDAIGMIDDDLIVNARARRPVRRKRFLMPGIAAAAAAIALTVGASAAFGRNPHLLTRWFGEKGESVAAEEQFPAPVSYENDRMRLTVETEIDDGFRHLILLSGTTLDGEPFNWHPDGVMAALVRTDGSVVPSEMGRSGFGWNENCLTMEDYVNDYPKYLACVIPAGDLEKEQCYLTFRLYDESKSTDNPAAGIRIPVGHGQNTPLVHFTNGGDTEISLSGFELISIGTLTDIDCECAVILRDGTRIKLDPKSADGRPLTDENGGESDVYRTARWEFDWIDVTQVAAVEVNGERYERAPGE